MMAPGEARLTRHKQSPLANIMTKAIKRKLMNKKIIIFITLLTLSCGTKKEFYESGTLKAKGKVANDLKTGMWKQYYECGEIFQIGKYLNGKETGEWKIFHENGQLRQIGKFNNGKQTGEWNFYHPNGKREGIGTLIDGKRNGIWKWYHTNGSIYTEREWDNERLVKIISCYDGQGNELDKGTFKNGNGTMKVYDIDGNLLETYNYKNGKYVKE